MAEQCVSFVHIRMESGDDDYIAVRRRIDKDEAQRLATARYVEWGYEPGEAWVVHVEVVDLGEEADEAHEGGGMTSTLGPEQDGS